MVGSGGRVPKFEQIVIFGKRILFSDKNSEAATNAVIVADYRSPEAAEGDFRQMKDPKVVSFLPMYHFTDQSTSRW